MPPEDPARSMFSVNETSSAFLNLDEVEYRSSTKTAFTHRSSYQHRRIHQHFGDQAVLPKLSQVCKHPQDVEADGPASTRPRQQLTVTSQGRQSIGGVCIRMLRRTNSSGESSGSDGFAIASCAHGCDNDEFVSTQALKQCYAV